MCLQTLSAILLLIALRVDANTSPENLTTTAGDALIGSIDNSNVVNQSEIVTVQFTHALSDASSHRSVLARQSSLYSLTYSRRAMKFTSNLTVFALPVPASDLRVTLDTAINNAGKHSASELQSNFISSASNLSVIMNSINKTVDGDSFNWQDFSSIASILLHAVTLHPNLNRTFVGMVKDSSGNPVVEVAVLPEYVIVGNDGEPSPLNMDPSSSSSAATAKMAPSHLPKRVIPHAQSRISGTTFTTTITLTPGRVHVMFLRTLMATAINMVAMDPGRHTYSAMVTESFANVVQNFMANASGRINFSLRTENIVRLRNYEMLAILDTIYQLVDADMYAAAQAATPSFWSWSGQIIDQLGAVIAQWSLGEPNQALGCSSFTATQADGSVIYGCLVT